MTFQDILYKFKDAFPFAKVDDYRPICHELFTDGKQGITIWLENGDVIEYYPKAVIQNDKGRSNQNNWVAEMHNQP